MDYIHCGYFSTQNLSSFVVGSALFILKNKELISDQHYNLVWQTVDDHLAKRKVVKVLQGFHNMNVLL